MIAVVGGGLTGLALAWELGRLGADCVVLEAASRPGGVVRTKVVDGRVLEVGPQRARFTPAFRRLVEQSGLSEELLIAPDDLDLLVYRAGKLRRVPFSLRELIGSDVVSPAAKLRLLAEPFTAGPDPDERVAAFFSRKLGVELYEGLVGPLYGGLYASDPADMVVGLSLQTTLRDLGVGRSLVLALLRARGGVRSSPACSFRSGMEALPEALARRLGDRVRLGTTARTLRRAGGGWIVETDHGGLGSHIEAEHVVLCVPASVAANMLRAIAPDTARVVGGLRYNPLAIVHLEAETPLRGLGFQVAFGERMTTRGVTFNGSLFGAASSLDNTAGFSRRNVYTSFLGGAQHPEVTRMDAEALAELGAQEFRILTGFEAAPLSVERQAMPAWDASWSALSSCVLPAGLHVAANWWSRPGIPGRLAEARRTAEALAGAARPTPGGGAREESVHP